MSSTVSKLRTSKNVKANTRKNGLISSKNDKEENATNSNAVSPYKRYNLRSYSSSKGQQLTSKGGKSINTAYEFSKNENPYKFKRKDEIIDKPISKEVYSAISDKNNVYSHTKKPFKSEKVVIAKSHIPKCLPLPASEAKNTGVKSKDNSFAITHTLVPYRSVLKRAPVCNSHMKNPHLPDKDQKDIIKERIFGPPALRQKKVQFKTISCYNLTCGNINSKDLEEAASKIDELNVSALGANNGEKSALETVSIDMNSGSNPAHIKLQKEEGSSSVKKFETTKTINVNKHETSFNEYPSPSQECKDHYIQTNTNLFTNPDEKSPILGLFSQNYIKGHDPNSKTCILNVSNEQESLKEKLFYDKTNNPGENVENFKILCDLKTAETSLDQEDEKSDLMKGDTLNLKEEKHRDNKATLSKDTNINSMHTILSPYSIPKAQDDSHSNLEQTKSKDLFKNKIEERVKNLTAHFLQEIAVKRNSKKKRRPKKAPRNGRSTIYDGCNVLQDTTGGEKEDFVQSSKEKGTYLLKFFNSSNAEDLSTSRKVFTFQQDPKVDLNLSNFRSPKVSKIPRLMQNLDNVLSPVWEIDCTPMKTKEIFGVEVAQNQNNVKCCNNSENEVKKTQDLNETMLIADNFRFSKEQEIDSLVEDRGTMSDSSRTSFSTCCEIEDSIMPVKNESLPDTDENNIRRTNDDEFKLGDNMDTSPTTKNNYFKGKKESLITGDKNKRGTGIQREAKLKSYAAKEGMRKDIYEKNGVEETCSMKNKRKVVVKTPVSRMNMSNKKCIVFSITFFVIATFYVLFLKILEHPLCDT